MSEGSTAMSRNDDLDLEWSSSGDSDFLREAQRKADKATKDKRQAGQKGSHMSDIAEKWANTPDPPRPTAQQDALEALIKIRYERLTLFDKERALDELEVRTARAAYLSGLDRPTIAKTLDRSLQTIHNWVNPDEAPKKGRRYGQPTDEQLREAGIDV